VKTFVSEIIQLNQLRDRVSKYYEAQQNVPSLLTQLDIMVALIDRELKIWYLNPANERFQKTNDLPRETCTMAFRGYKTTRACRGCIAAQTLQDGKNHERIYLLPIKGYGGRLKWIYTWTQPMPDEYGKPILSDDGKPIAVLESARDLTDSVQLRTMPMEEWLSHIADALYETENGFDRVRIYQADTKSETLNLVAHAGYPKEVKPAVIEISDFGHIKKSIQHFRRNAEGSFYNKIDNWDPIFPEAKMKKLIHWPLMKGHRIMGLISVSDIENGRPLTENGVDIIRNYAEEALKAFEQTEKNTRDLRIEKKISNIDNILIQKRTLEDTLQTLIDEVYGLTESDNVHIRYRDENNARLLPIGKGGYNEVAPLEIPLSRRMFPSVHAIIAGQEEIRRNTRRDPDVKKFMEILPDKARKELKDMGSYCVEPLIFQNRCIGSLTLFKNEINYYNEERIEIAREIADRMGLALHDYLVSLDRMRKDYAFESSINAIAFADLDDKFNYVNESFLKLWCYATENEVIGKPIAKLWKEKKKTYYTLKKLHNEGRWFGEPLALRKNGSTFYAQVSANVVKDPTGKIIGSMASFIDITERKRLEKVQKSIYRISEEASSAKNLDGLYPKIHAIINELISANNFYIALYDEKTKTVSFPYFIDQKDLSPPPRRHSLGMTEYVIRTGKPVLASKGILKELEKKGEIKTIGTPSNYWLGVPLKTTDQKTIGVLVVQNYEESLKYTEEDKDILVFVSTQIAMAIERKREEEMKAVMLHEIFHRVKNNFNFIYSLLDMQSRQIEDHHVREQFASTKDRILLMAMVHEKLYQSENLSEIDFTRYVKDLSDSLFKTYSHEEDKISLKLKIDNVTFGIDKAIPFGMIINELVTNSLKYAFPPEHKKQDDSENKIVIELYPENEDFMVLRVMDNGVGLPEDMNFFETPSLGVRLVRLLTKQIHGTIDLNRSCGTDVTIKFKV
jgi:PAS domain S-box-containing protein